MSNKFACLKIILPCICILLLLSSCYKLQDYIHHPGSTTYDDCDIKKIVSIAGAHTITFAFAYNKSGTPASITNDLVGTGNPYFFFTYDKKNRLTQFLKSYTNGLYRDRRLL